MPKISYDYQAALGEFGQIRESYSRLKSLHFFTRFFGEKLAPMETVLPEGTAKVLEAAFSPLMIYITVETKADPEALAQYMEESDAFEYGISSFDSWLCSLQLVDSEGKPIDIEGSGLETSDQEFAQFLYIFREDLPDELWLAPVYNEDEPADMSEAVLVRSAK